MQKNKILLTLFSCIATLTTAVYADEQYDFDNAQAGQTQNAPPIIQQAITINRTFPSMAAVLQKLNSLGLTATIKNANQYDLQNQQIKTATTVNDFITAAAAKFNYTAIINGNNVTFAGMYPPKPTPSPIPTIAPKLAATAAPLASTAAAGSNTTTTSNVVSITNNWTYTPNDTYISNTLSRWSKQAGYQLVWKTSSDFAVQSTGSLSGGFKSAVNEVLKSFKYSEHPIKADWYKNNVVVITDFSN